MEAQKILAKAESHKRRMHHLSLDLRLRTVTEARRFIREQGVLLWIERAELPCMLDAILGRIANPQERLRGKPRESCSQWRRQLLKDLDLLECSFFRKRCTVIHQDLWPYLAVCSRANRTRSEEDGWLTRDARRVLSFVAAEGPTRTDLLRRALKCHSVVENRAFQRAVRELCDRLVLVAREEQDSPARSRVSVLECLENAIPKPVRARSESFSEKDASAKLMAATVNSCVVVAENKMKRWFPWSQIDAKEILEIMLRNRDCLRVQTRQGGWIVSRKALGLKKTSGN